MYASEPAGHRRAENIMDWVRRIAAAVEWTPLRLHISWDEIERELGTRLPHDFKEFCETFGRGQFSEWLNVYSSAGGAEHVVVGKLAFLRSLGADLSELLEGYELFSSEQAGVIPWGSCEQGSAYYWLANGDDPDRWPVMCLMETGGWARYEMTMSEFSYRLIADANFDIGYAREYYPPTFEPASLS